MPEFETPNEQYVRDFNNGYLIAKENPSLAKNLMRTQFPTENTGLIDGINQQIKELQKGNTPSWLNQKQKNTAEKGRGLDLERE